MTTMTESSTEGCPRKFQIDYSRWRCGGRSSCKDKALGLWETKLRNPTAASQGDPHHMCCLGLMFEASGASRMLLDDNANPADVRKACDELPGLAAEMPESFHALLQLLTYTSVPDPSDQFGRKRRLEEIAMEINDEMDTLIEVKMRRLIALFAQVGVELEFTNVPDEYL